MKIGGSFELDVQIFEIFNSVLGKRRKYVIIYRSKLLLELTFCEIDLCCHIDFVIKEKHRLGFFVVFIFPGTRPTLIPKPTGIAS